jgi:hypothetical protein
MALAANADPDNDDDEEKETERRPPPPPMVVPIPTPNNDIQSSSSHGGPTSGPDHPPIVLRISKVGDNANTFIWNENYIHKGF